jgi:transposase
MFALCYKLHLSIDAKSMLPLANVFASANQNEKKHSLTLLEKTRQILGKSKAKIRSESRTVNTATKNRDAVAQTVIPYPSNQKRGVKGILRVDKKFRTYGPDELRKEYHKRSSVEAVYSFLKTQYSMASNKVRGLRNVVSYTLFSILCLVLNREAAQNIGRVDKAVSPTYFNT